MKKEPPKWMDYVGMACGVIAGLVLTLSLTIRYDLYLMATIAALQTIGLSVLYLRVSVTQKLADSYKEAYLNERRLRTLVSKNPSNPNRYPV